MSARLVSRPVIAVACIILLSSASAQDVNDVLRLAFNDLAGDLNDVDYMVKRLKAGELPGAEGSGACASGRCQAYKKETYTAADGGLVAAMRHMTHQEVLVAAGLTAEAAQLKASGLVMIGLQHDFNEALRSNAPAGMGGLVDVLDHSGALNEQASYMNPMTMLETGGLFMLAGGVAVGNAADAIQEGAATARREQERRESFARNATLGPVEEIDGRRGQRIDFNNVDQEMHAENGQVFVLNNASLWIDTENRLMLRHLVNGTAIEDGTERQFFMESTASDFRVVADTSIVQPYKTTMRMGGVLTDDQRAQLEEARKQLAEFDAQLAAMPADQRRMVENMMGQQMDTLRSMADDGVIEHVQIIEEIYINPDLAALYGGGAPAGALHADEETLVQRIQRDLQRLGYAPGNTDGDLTTATVVAISQYQAENGLDVTGEPSEELARRLAAAKVGR